jgi:hypothetical protein
MLVHAQDKTELIRKTLDWQADKVVFQGQRLLYFDGAVNHDSLGLLPVFQFPLSAQTRVSAQDLSIADGIYEPFEIEDVAAYADLNLIGNEPRILLSSQTTRGVTTQYISILPVRIRPDKEGYEKLVSFSVYLEKGNRETAPEAKQVTTRNYAEHSVLSSGDWYKLSVTKTGIYKISYQDLADLGIEMSSVDPRNIRIYGNGSGMLDEANAVARPDDLLENSIYVRGEEDGSFNQDDYILFYGEGPVVTTWNAFYLQYEHEVNFYTDETCYFLNIGENAGKRVSNGVSIADATTDELYGFQDIAYHEKDSLNLIKSGKLWFGEVFNNQVDYTFPFELTDIDVTQPVVLKANLAARSTEKTIFNVYANGNFLTDIDIPSVLLSSYIYARPIISNYESFTASGENVDVGIRFEKPGSIDEAWMNYIELNYIRQLKFRGGQLSFRDMRYAGADNIFRYHVQTVSQDLNLWEVTDPGAISKPVVSTETNGITFKTPGDRLREFIIFDGTDYLTPGFKGKIDNQDLHGSGPVDFLIVTHPLFMDQAERLAEYHQQHDGMTTLIVTPEQVYNEFSSGVQDICSIRDFVKMIYDRAQPEKKPRYLLLFGDASYDYKHRLSVDNNFVPAYQSRESLKYSASYVTDDFFGCMDNDEGSTGSGTMDLGIGRFPVSTAEEAKEMVDKCISYMSQDRQNFGPWRNDITFVGDDKDNNTHLNQAEGLAGITDSLGTVYNIDKIYLDAYEQFKTANGVRYPDVNKAINKNISDGCLIFNYTGHGGEVALADERVLDIPAIQSFDNIHNLPLFVTATCEFSRFDDPSLVSAGELSFLNPSGASIGLLTTTRQAYSTSNYAYNKRFYFDAFGVDSLTGENPRLGDLLMAAKTPSNQNIKNFVLLGDPALMLAYPKMRVSTLSVTTEDPDHPADTVRAQSKVTITGQVEDLNGNLLGDFNGLVYTSVFDKPVLYKTRGNEPQSKVVDFYIQNKKIFQGQATVVNGTFSFSFIVPVDVGYQFGKGKISYYALDTNKLIDANGYDEVIVGGNDPAIVDNEGPQIDLYLNTLSFVSGDLTSQSPLLIANLFDDSGINAVGNGIGHDLVAVIDGNYQEQIILNDYFRAETDSYQAGTIEYELGPFENGKHTLTLKAWDIFNNSSEKSIEFEVNVGARLVVSDLQCRPNPFRTGGTSFSFQYNKPGSQLDVTINIVNLTGQHVTTLSYSVDTESIDSGLLAWDGKDDSGNELSSGLYVYNLLVRSDDGYVVSVSQKFLHFR